MGITFKSFCYILLLFIGCIGLCDAALRFTNLQCDEFDSKFAKFNRCELTVPARGKVILNLYVELFKLPVNNVSVNLAILKKASGYRPFLYNVSANFCQFMLNEKRSPLLKIFLNIFRSSSNINHSCPYNHDIVVKDLELSEEKFKYLPLPSGEYLFDLSVGAYNDVKARIRTYISFVWEFN